MKNIVIGLATAALLLLSSCEDYLDVNQNPNEATNASPALMLPGVMQGIATRVNVDVNLDFPTWMGYWAHADGWSGWFDIKQYQITTNNQQDFFNVPYREYLMDLAFIEKNSQASMDANYLAVGKILKSFVYGFLVDAYGDVPYSQACKGITAPVYDDAQTIYTSLIGQLDTAIMLIYNTPVTNDLQKDFMFDGDMESWAKFANTLKLKLMLRQVGVSGYTPHTDGMDTIGFLETDALFDPGYGSTNMQPYYSNFGFTVSGGLANRRTQYCMNAYIQKVYDDLGDPREFRTFDPSKALGTYAGKQFGNEGDGIHNPFNKDTGNLIGAGLVELDVTAANPSLIMSGFESYFLQAEAVERGWLTGDAKALYESAVIANFSYLGITDDTTAANYLAQDNGGTNYDVATDKLSLILNQKYIAFCGINGFEAWCEYRRTGIPDPKASDPDYSMISYYKGVPRKEIPHLLYYPQREFNLNNLNTKAATLGNYGKEQDASYQFDARVFWDVTPVK
jgi:hypothetical protein